MSQNYSANAVPTTITGGISNSDTTLTLASAVGWPTAPFVATLERDTPREEQIYVGARTSTSCSTITRGYGSTTAVSHASGAVIEHTADAVSMQRWEDHLTDATSAHAASAISNTPAGGIAATTVQAALNELDGDKAAVAEPIAAAHIVDTSAAHAASAISVDSTTLVGVGTDLQAVLEELDNSIVAGGGDISAHLADTTAAHAASAVSFSPTGTIAGTDVQTALAEVATEYAAADAAAAAKQIIAGAGLIGGGDQSADRTLTVGAGTGITVNADDVAINQSVINTGAPDTTWTVTFGGTGGALGSATVSKRWVRVGRLIHWWLSIKTGSGTNLSTSGLTITLPVDAEDPGSFYSEVGSGRLVDVSANNSFAVQCHIDHDASNSVMKLSWLTEAFDINLLDEVGNTYPSTDTQAANDLIILSGVYVAAS